MAGKKMARVNRKNGSYCTGVIGMRFNSNDIEEVSRYAGQKGYRFNREGNMLTAYTTDDAPDIKHFARSRGMKFREVPIPVKDLTQ